MSDPPQPKTTEIAVAVVIDRDRALIGPRPAGVPLAGLWEFPGGKIRFGESPSDTALRECREESGLLICVERRLAVVEHDYSHGRVRIHFFAARPLEPNLPPAAPFQWVELARLSEYPFPAANAPVIRAILGLGFPSGTVPGGRAMPEDR